MIKRDYYDVLGVDRDADDATIKKAFRSMAMQFHPDRNPDPSAVERMKELNEAYAVLCDAQKRARYDKYGHAGLDGMSQEDIFGGIDFGSIFGDFGGSIFEQFFGGQRASRGPRRGADLKLEVEITLEEAASGVKKEIQLSKMMACPSCRGAGAESGGVTRCEACGGAGQTVHERRMGFSVFRQVGACSACGGRGKVIKDKCRQCRGKGSTEQTKKVTLDIPKGIDTGQGLRVSGEGGQGEPGAGAGDLYISISVKKHDLFERRGDDLVLVKEISFVQAALGDKIAVPSLNGDLKLEIPEGTQTGTVFRFNGKGMPRVDSFGRGDLYVSVKVVTPTKLGSKAKDLMKQLAEMEKARAEEASGKKKDKQGEDKV